MIDIIFCIERTNKHGHLFSKSLHWISRESESIHLNETSNMPFDVIFYCFYNQFYQSSLELPTCIEGYFRR